MTQSTFDTEIDNTDDMREEVRKLFEYLATLVQHFAVKQWCPICGKILINRDDLEVFDQYLDAHLWGEHKWVEVGKWIAEQYDHAMTTLKMLNPPMKP